jgi:hypothetical protein
MAEINGLDSSGSTLDRTGWTASADSANGSFPASNVLDGNTGTIWHTEFSGSNPPHPHLLTIDMGSEQEIAGIRVTPRQGSNSGDIITWEVEISSDGSGWTMVANGDWDYGESWDGEATRDVLFDDVQLRHIVRSAAQVAGPYTLGMPSTADENFATKRLVAVFWADTQAGSPSADPIIPPGGSAWVRDATANVSDGGTQTLYVEVWSRPAESGDTGTAETWTLDDALIFHAAVWCLQNVSPTDYLADFAVQTGSGTTATFGAVDAARDGSFELAVLCLETNQTSTLPSGGFALIDNRTNIRGWRALVDTGSRGSTTSTLGGSTTWLTARLVYQPAGEAAGTGALPGEDTGRRALRRTANYRMAPRDAQLTA